MPLFLFLIPFVLNNPEVMAKPKPKRDHANPGYILFFQPLTDLPQTISQKYLRELAELLRESSSPTLNNLIVERTLQDNCFKMGLKSCQPGIYGYNVCFKQNKDPGYFCYKYGKLNSIRYFQESVFNRLHWNRFALRFNYACVNRETSLCKKIHKLNIKYLGLYFKQVNQKRGKNKKGKRAKRVRKKKVPWWREF